MGRNKNEHWDGLLVQKDQEIAALETQVQAYIAMSSILQTRLLSTLDTLDMIQSRQNKELDAMAQTNRRLMDKLHRYSTIVKTAALERDDMRDAVLKLVEKVELSNDYSMWPHSQIRLSSLAGAPIFQSPIIQPSESDLLLHATTMIESLRRERDFERKVHTQACDTAQARIVSLQAQLSRREAELETFISDVGRTVPIIRQEHPRHADQLTDEPLTTEQVISALDSTMARNKALEIEITGLFKRLEDARLAVSSSNVDGPPPPPLSRPQQRREMQRSLNPITTGILPRNTTLQSTSVLGVLGEPTICERSRPDAEQTLVFPDINSQAMEELEHQIETLGAKIDAFAGARRSMSQALQTDIHKENPSYSVEARLEYLENENHRLRLSEQSLRDELDAARISAQAQENELLDEIRSLQSNQQVVLKEPNVVYSLLEPDNGEISMELSTPLLPTIVMLDMNSSHGRLLPPYLDPLSIPLPPSPDNHPTPSSPPLSQIILSDINAHHERPDSKVNEMENSAKAFHPP